VSVITPFARPANTSKTLTADQLRRIRNPFNVFQLDATAYPGNSGSPVYEPDTGRVIGVINSVFVKEGKESMLAKPTGISYAIPVNYVKALLQEASNAP
jgi:serine protease Do